MRSLVDTENAVSVAGVRAIAQTDRGHGKGAPHVEPDLSRKSQGLVNAPCGHRAALLRTALDALTAFNEMPRGSVTAPTQMAQNILTAALKQCEARLDADTKL